MGKHSGKDKKQKRGQSGDGNVKQSKAVDNSAKAYDKDVAVFISMAQGLKEEGNKLFQKRDHEGAMLKYEKALKLLPRNHIDVSHLRSNMAACYMQMGLAEYPRAIHECNLALEVTPKYGKALLKRARCYEALNNLPLALRDVCTVLAMEPNNLMALEISERVQATLRAQGLMVNDSVIELKAESVEADSSTPELKGAKEKSRKKNKKSIKAMDKKTMIEEKKIDEKVDEKNSEDKVVVEEKIRSKIEEEPRKNVKLVFGEDIRWAQVPLNCTLLQLREVIHDRFPSSRAVLVKYRDHEGDLVTITSDEELRSTEALTESQGSLRLYVAEVNPKQDPFFERFSNDEVHKFDFGHDNAVENGTAKMVKEPGNGSYFIDDWIVQFGQLFKNYVGFDSDAYLNLHELGMKEYNEAMEETVTSEEAMKLFDGAADKFQEMAALALFNWGNVHMSRARKKVYITEDGSSESILHHLKKAYDWAQEEYTKAGQRYEEALRIKPNFYEGRLALGQQQYEKAKLSWYYAISSNVDLKTWPSEEVLQLYNHAEENMDCGMQMWEESEGQRLRELSKPKQVQTQLQKLGLDGLFKDIPGDEAVKQAMDMNSQINLLWGTMLYERSIMEFKLGLPVWQECLEVAVEKFELAGASSTDIAVMLKNHCSNNSSLEGIGFKIDEIIQAWNEMYEAKRWQRKIPSFRLEPLLRRRVSKIYHILDHAHVAC